MGLTSSGVLKGRASGIMAPAEQGRKDAKRAQGGTKRALKGALKGRQKTVEWNVASEKF